MTVLFVCTGNTCRSPMAEAIAKHIFKSKNIVAVITSRGLSVFTKSPMAANAVKALENHDIPFEEHTSTPLSLDDMDGADLILTMTESLKNAVLTFEPALSKKTYTLYNYITGEDKDIEDPFGKDYQAYEDCFNELYSLLDKFKFKGGKKIVALGCDHAGFQLKNTIIQYFEKNNISYKDYGTYSEESVDYPIYGRAVAQAVISGEASKGIVICSTGIGICIAANKIKGIRAALCHDVFSAKATREHNNANILAMGANVIGVGPALEIVEAFLNTEFSNYERHLRRINMIEPD